MTEGRSQRVVGRHGRAAEAMRVLQRFAGRFQNSPSGDYGAVPDPDPRIRFECLVYT